MARRRLTPAQPGYLSPATPSDVKRALPAAAPPIAKVSGQSAEAAALSEMVEGLQLAHDEGRMLVDVPLTDVFPGFLIRDRIAMNREDLDGLKASIKMHGQRVPAEISPLDPETDVAGAGAYTFGLISGWRRLTALGELHLETGDPKFATLRALIRPAQDAASSYVAMIEENEIRVGLSYFERARVVAELTRSGVFADQATALRDLFANASRAKRSKIGSFVELVDAFGEVLKFPAEIPERLGLQLVAHLRQGGPQVGDDIRAALRKAAPSTAEAELALLTRALRRPPPAKSPPRPQTKEALRPGLVMKVSPKPDGFVLTLTGEKANPELLDEIRRLLRAQTGES